MADEKPGFFRKTWFLPPVFEKIPSYVDVWCSRKLINRFGFHWERRHLDGRIYRYDNFPDTKWSDVSTFPFHFHDGDQDTVIAAPFAPELEQGFRDFIAFVERTMS